MLIYLVNSLPFIIFVHKWLLACMYNWWCSTLNHAFYIVLFVWCRWLTSSQVSCTFTPQKVVQHCELALDPQTRDSGCSTLSAFMLIIAFSVMESRELEVTAQDTHYASLKHCQHKINLSTDWFLSQMSMFHIVCWAHAVPLSCLQSMLMDLKM